MTSNTSSKKELVQRYTSSGTVHSTDNSLQVSDEDEPGDASATDVAVATTRLNTWLNGGSNSAIPLELGTGSITAVTPIHPFRDSTTARTSVLPSPFLQKRLSGKDQMTMPPSPPKEIGSIPLRQVPSIISTTETIPVANKAAIPANLDNGSSKKDTIQGPKSDPIETTNTELPTKPQHVRQRSVSWGEHPNVSTLPPKAPKISPKLSPVASPQHRRGPSEFSLFSVLTQTDSEDGDMNNNNSMDGVNLGDLLRMNPLETEAETLILKVIEAKDNANRQRANTGNSILQNIPDDAVDVFLPPKQPDEIASTKSSAASTSNYSKRQNLIDSPPEVIQNDQPISQTLQSSSINSSDRTNRLASSPPAAINSIPNQSKQRPPRPNLNRATTVEYKLANLTDALAGYHNNNSHNDDNVEQTYESSAGEKLAKNAQLIYRGRQKTDGKQQVENKTKVQYEDTSDHSGTNNHNAKPSHWNKVRLVTAISTSQPHHNDQKTIDSNMILPSTSGVNDYKKTDVHDDSSSSHPQQHQVEDAMECGAVITPDDDKRSKPNSDGESRPLQHDENMRQSWKLYQKIPMINNSATKDFLIFLRQRRNDFYNYIRFMIVVVLPALATSFILYYAAGNPNTGIVDIDALIVNGTYVSMDNIPIEPNKASVSWWLIFVCVRQTFTFSAAQLIQLVVVDFLCLSTRFSVNVLGNLLTLFIVQSKGWPFVVIMWSVMNFSILYGSSRFVKHWLYWQELLGLFNARNPAGNITSDIWYTQALSTALCLGFVVALKRLWLGLFLGRKTYVNYAEDLAKLADKILILCEIAALSRDIETDLVVNPSSLKRSLSVSQYGLTRQEFENMLVESDDEDDSKVSKNRKEAMAKYQGGLIVDPAKSDFYRVRLDQSQRAKITELLGAWEEPDAEISVDEDVSISGILQFRNSLAYLNNSYMFSIAWGETTTRERTILGSQEVFTKLMKRSTLPNQLKFEVLAAIAKQSDGTLNHEKLKKIIRILRPDRDGNLSLLEFVKSVDVVYKEAKLLRASVLNSEKIDRAFERAFNVVFYILTAGILLAVFGLNPLTLIVSLTSIIVGFAFMVGSASSKMFEGWLFILIRRPYNIGDRIHISNVENDVDPDGSLGWIVKDLTLFHTTAVYGMTGERATMSNGSLASSRVINMARSPKAQVYIYLKFATDIPYERVKIFEKALREFVKSRPREWANFNGFRATKVWADLGYIEYVVALVHREAWQSVISIVESKAEVSSFCLELAKKLEIRYKSPPLPVDLAFVRRTGTVATSNKQQTDPIVMTTTADSTNDNNTATSGQLRDKFAAMGNDESSAYKEIVAMFDSGRFS